MNNTIRNILSVFAGAILGSVVNMGIIMMSGKIIPPPDGADVTTMEGLQASMHLFQPKHFLMPFLAHALGTFAGAWITARMVLDHKLRFALIIGFVFLAGGIANVFMLPSPLWFNLTDILLAYIPFAFAAGKLVSK